MKHETFSLLKDAGPAAACTSYAAVMIAYVQSIDVMQLGALLLLLARMIQDLPPAYKSLKRLLLGTKKAPAKKKKKPKARH